MIVLQKSSRWRPCLSKFGVPAFASPSGGEAHLAIGHKNIPHDGGCFSKHILDLHAEIREMRVNPRTLNVFV